jgi:hypothetical protein
MPKTQEILPRPAGPTHAARSVVFLAFPTMGLLDVTGPQTVFWSAAQHLVAQGAPGYKRHTVSAARHDRPRRKRDRPRGRRHGLARRGRACSVSGVAAGRTYA